MSAVVREATAADLPDITRFLASRFGGEGGEARYRRYLEYSWLPDKPNLGYLCEDAGEIRGFTGGVYARREIRGEQHWFCNLTSLMVDDAYRKYSLQMLKQLLARPDVTYTSFSASDGVTEILRFFKFTILEGAKVVFSPAAGLTAPLFGVKLHRGKALAGRLSASERQILTDHAPYRCGHFLLEADGRRCYFVTVRRGRGLKAFADVIHCSDPALLARHIGRVHLAVGLEHKTALIGIDRRFVSAAPPGAFVYSRLRPIIFRSPSLLADDIDMLYSEVVPMHG